MTTPVDAILARRRLTNKLIAAKAAVRLRPFFDPRVNVIVGDGTLITGVEAVIAAFAAQFSDPDFVAFVRTPDVVELDTLGARAAERGTWVAVSRSEGEHIAGWYLAAWTKARGQWLIESETFVTLRP
ncbi:MAG: nuclear transport factor 2 family protein [Phenylobacterium sp.]|uniref:nuclear transport factor 2 family protein n=1 Tax=Phenylobacterium sp. TaxID=1871053 RepID=UPI0025F72187|nr:nuclear transport factor 2 family protein [Phenylobacterium sp.]MCG9917364.1 nuclear transport factor 2 family protein [Phenylobacterium sp.]